MPRVRMSDKKTVLVTGATSGIGRETARLLFSSGYDVLLVGRNEESLAEVSKETGSSQYIVSDLEITKSIKDIFDVLMERGIRLDGMVHAAGYVINVPLRSCSIEHMEKQMRINYYAFVELCKQFYKRKVSNDGASIVAVSSLASLTKLKGSVLYASSKCAMNSAVTIASKEFLSRLIRVNGVMPGYVDTRMTEGLGELIDINEKQPFGLIPPQSVAEVIEFLLSDRSKYITGALIPVSAGMEF